MGFVLLVLLTYWWLVDALGDPLEATLLQAMHSSHSLVIPITVSLGTMFLQMPFQIAPPGLCDIHVLMVCRLGTVGTPT